MCLGDIVQVTDVTAPGSALVSGHGRIRPVSLVTLSEPVEPGDWLVIHSGFALARLTADEAREATELRAGAAATNTEGSG